MNKGKINLEGIIVSFDKKLESFVSGAQHIYFGVPTDRADRTTLFQQRPQMQKLGLSIYAVSRPQDTGASFEADTMNQNATVFVIDERSLFLTNHHVASQLGCFPSNQCSIRFSRRSAD